MDQVEVPPPLLVQVAAVDSHEVGEKSMDYSVGKVTESDSVLFGKGQWDTQLQSMGQRKDATGRKIRIGHMFELSAKNAQLHTQFTGCGI